MGKIARYLRALSDEQRDNVIQAEEFGNGQYFDWRGVGCLVGVAELEFDNTDDYHMPPVAMSLGFSGGSVGEQFDILCTRFGKDRIVAACKNRAAKGNRLHEIREEVVADRQRTAFMYGSTLLGR